MDISWWSTYSDVKWLQVESGSEEEKERDDLEGDKHWMVQYRFKEDCNEGENKTI